MFLGQAIHFLGEARGSRISGSLPFNRLLVDSDDNR